MIMNKFILTAILALTAPSSVVYSMNGILECYDLPNATVEQFESLQQITDGICGACAIANAVAIDDILRDSGTQELTPANVQSQASLYPETTINAYLYGLRQRPTAGGLTGHEILKYANSHGLENVFFLRENLSLFDIDGSSVDANVLRSQIYFQNSIVVYFLCDVSIQNDLHTVLAVLIKEQRHRTRIIYMDSNNILLQNYPTAINQLEFISYFV